MSSIRLLRPTVGLRKFSSGTAVFQSRFKVKTYNAIAPQGVARLPSWLYDVSPDGEDEMAIMLRSHQLKADTVPSSCRAIARCGAGVNNVPVDEMTARGIPVFNSPGANANSVKELVLCSLFLASRGIVQGINHMNTIYAETDPADVKSRVESDKKMFGGLEVAGKTLGVIGLGHIGCAVAEDALALGMKVVGYDPAMSVEAAWRLPGAKIDRVTDMNQLLPQCDFVTLHVPYIKDATHHLLNQETLQLLKPTCNILNFSRAELVDSDAMRSLYNSGHRGQYICDFPLPVLHGLPRVMEVPHLGASTEEAEINSASMAADEIRDFLEHGIINNSVNFPTVNLKRLEPWPDSGGTTMRLCIINNNQPGVLGEITNKLGSMDLNITQAVNSSRNEIAYNVVDLDMVESAEDRNALLETMSQLEGVLSVRLVVGEPGTNFVTKQ